ncbi:MAG: cell division ATPase MinD [Halobacteriota archaeon]|nr:cell division ATPase MinD [Halobacteriota archaeon]
MGEKVYTIASGKGGTGKTTTSVNLGTSLAMLGKSTLIMDADIGMANLGLIIGMENSPVTLHEVLAGRAEIEQAIYDGPQGVRVVPSGISLQGFQNSDPERLRDVMVRLIEGVDFLLIDAPAGISKDAIIPMAIADEVILVVNPELSSMADALKTKVLTEMVGGKVGGIILNRVGTEKTELTVQKVRELIGAKVLGTVPEDTNVRTSAAFKTPIVVRTANSPAALAYKRIAADIAGEEYEEEEATAEKKEGFADRIARSLFGGRKK